MSWDHTIPLTPFTHKKLQDQLESEFFLATCDRLTGRKVHVGLGHDPDLTKGRGVCNHQRSKGGERKVWIKGRSRSHPKVMTGARCPKNKEQTKMVEGRLIQNKRDISSSPSTQTHKTLPTIPRGKRSTCSLRKSPMRG